MSPAVAIPPLPENLISCINYVYEGQFDYDVFVGKITGDVGIVDRVFILANSLYYAQGRPPTSDLRAALVRIGSDNLLKILTADYYSKNYRHVDVDFFTIRDFNKHANFVTKLSVSIAKHLNLKHTGDLFLGSLFHDVGLVAKAYLQPNLMKQTVESCKKEGKDFFSQEKSRAFDSHDSLGKSVASQWNFNKKVTFLIGNHHTFDRARHGDIDLDSARELDILGIADVLAHKLRFSFHDYQRNTAVNQIVLDRLGLSQKILAQLSYDTIKAVSCPALF